MADPELTALLESWEIALRAARRSEQTIESYRLGVRLYLRWCGPDAVLDRRQVQRWTAALLANGASANTARTRQLAVRRFSAWLAAEGEIDADPLLGLRAPRADVKVTESLTDDELRLLIKACSGKRFIDRRDEAVVRLMAATGMRAGELLGLEVTDIDLPRGIATVRRGKGGRGRVVPFGPQVTAALDRYMRSRRLHPKAHTPALWLGGGGQGFGYTALDKAIKLRAAVAGIQGFHLHLLRHTAASRWLAAGGSEGGLMAVAGWRSREMLDRYTRSTAAARAAAEARALCLDDL